jgi:hypothetical protein
MRIWYVHEARRGWHERNLYLCHEMLKVWKEDGHKAAILNVAGPTHARAIKGKNATCDVAFINNFQAVNACEREGLDIVKRSRFRVLITGGGWRWPDWVRKSISAVSKVKANLVCLTHLPHYDKFKEVHKRVFHVGLGFDPIVFYPDWECEKQNIIFYGDGGMGRNRRLKLLEDAFSGQVDFNVDCAIPHKKMAEMMRAGAIGWNQIGRGPEDGVSCNLRVWETIGSGLFLLCSRSKHVPLKDGVHYVAWDSDEDMLDKAKYYLDHPGEREAIARQGWEESANHTWRHRAMEYEELVEGHL